MYCVLEKYHIYMVVWDVMDYSELFYMYCVLDVYWNYSIVDELNVSFVVLRNSAANAAVAAIAAVFFKLLQIASNIYAFDAIIGPKLRRI